MKDEKTAKFESIYEKLLGDIQNGSFLPGSKLPTETVLAQRFGVSRNTLRQALMLLTQEGYISNQQGRGTFVLQNVPENAQSFEQVINPMEKCAKRKITRKTMEFSIQNTNKEIRERFGLDASKLLIKVCISYHAEDTCVGHAEAFIPYDLLAESKVPLDNVESIFKYYEYLITRSDIKGSSDITITTCDAPSEKYDLKEHEVQYLISEQYRDKTGRIVLIQDLWMKISEYEIKIHKPFRI